MMSPTFTYETPAPKPPKVTLWTWAKRIIRTTMRLLFVSPFKRDLKFRNEDGTRASRFFRGLMYRMAFAPLVLVIFLTAIVVAATHPKRAMHGADPSSMGIYYDPVNFLAADNTRLDGWLVPVVDAKKVLEEKENIIGKRYPAVVLVHDFDGSRQQLLPMVRPLHEAGFVVLALNLRGAATISGEAQTFGIREAMDVKAAVEMLRRRPFVDPDRVALIGIGTGANACLLTAKGDDAIRTLVLTAPTANFDEVFATRVGADKRWLPPLRNLFRWTFQVMYGVDTSDLEFARFAPLVAERHVLVTDERQRLMEPTYIKGVQNFLRKHMNDAVAIAQ